MARHSQNSLSKTVGVLAVFALGGAAGYVAGDRKANESWLSDLRAPDVPKGDYSLQGCREELRRFSEANEKGNTARALDHLSFAADIFHYLRPSAQEEVRPELSKYASEYALIIRRALLSEPEGLEIFRSYEFLVADGVLPRDPEIYKAVTREYLRRAAESAVNNDPAAMLSELDEAVLCADLAAINISSELRAIKERLFKINPAFAGLYTAIEQQLKTANTIKSQYPSNEMATTVVYLDKALRKELFGDQYFYADFLGVALRSYPRLNAEEQKAIFPVLSQAVSRAEVKVTEMKNNGQSIQHFVSDLDEAIGKFKGRSP